MEIISKSEAIKQGLNYYFTGKPCKKGHVARRLLSSPHCTQCKLEKRKQRYKNNIEQERERGKQYHYANRESALIRMQEWQRNNSELVNERNRNYRAERREKFSAINKQWREKNRAYILHKNAMRKKYIKLATPKWADLNAICKEYELAAWCSQATGITYHVDHVIPLQGKLVCGLHVHNNLQVIPATDNLRKNNFFTV